MSTVRRRSILRGGGCAALLTLLLAGCDVAGEDELRRWMAEARQATRPGVPPLAEPKRFAPTPYDSRGTVDPFNPSRVAVALDRQQRAQAGAGAIKPDLDRPRDPLEQFPLEQIRMVGYLFSKGRAIGLVDAGTGTSEIRIGQYMGRNFGLVTAISETEIKLREIVQDSSGEWIEREASLELQTAPRGALAGGTR